MKPENLTLAPTDTAPTVARTCPRCSHARKPTDDAPAWQCPRCEVAYDKVLPAETASRHDRNQPVARTRPAPQRPWTLILLAGMVAAMLGACRTCESSAANRPQRPIFYRLFAQ